MPAQLKYFFVRHEGRYTKVVFEEVLYFESLQNFVKVHYRSKELLLLITLRQLERALPDSFCRIHRSYIVNTMNIQSFDAASVDFGSKTAPVARRFKKVLPEKMQVIDPENRNVPLIARMDMRNLLN